MTSSFGTTLVSFKQTEPVYERLQVVLEQGPNNWGVERRREGVPQRARRVEATERHIWRAKRNHFISQRRISQLQAIRLSQLKLGVRWGAFERVALWHHRKQCRWASTFRIAPWVEDQKSFWLKVPSSKQAYSKGPATKLQPKCTQDWQH